MFVVRNEFSDEDPEAFALGRGRHGVDVCSVQGVEGDPVRDERQVRLLRLF